MRFPRCITAVALIVAALFTLAAVTPRDIRQVSKDVTATLEPLLESAVTTLDQTSASCFRYPSAGAAVTCSNTTFTQIVWPRRARVENLQAVVYTKGDTGYKCSIDILVGASAVTGAVTLTIDTASTMVQQEAAQNAILEKGDVVTVQITDGSASCDGTADPVVVMRLQGRWL